jgi:hypothetical protein
MIYCFIGLNISFISHECTVVKQGGDVDLSLHTILFYDKGLSNTSNINNLECID